LTSQAGSGPREPLRRRRPSQRPEADHRERAVLVEQRGLVDRDSRTSQEQWAVKQLNQRDQQHQRPDSAELVAGSNYSAMQDRVAVKRVVRDCHPGELLASEDLALEHRERTDRAQRLEMTAILVQDLSEPAHHASGRARPSDRR
jgi:hypothetical protein